MDCCNFDCPNKVCGIHLRCSRCKLFRIFTCAICGDTLHDTTRAVQCKDCHYALKKMYQVEYSRNYHRKRHEEERIDKKCAICKIVIPYNKKYCSKECNYVNWKKKWRKRNIQNCEVCNKDLTDSGRQKTCSIECYTYYRRRRCRDYQYKRKDRSYVPIPLSR